MSDHGTPSGTSSGTPLGAPKRAFSLPPSKAQIEKELRDEFQFHIDERIEQFVAEGMTREQAKAEVERRFGDYESHRMLTKQIDEETMHIRQRREWFRNLLRELRLAARSLRRAPGFTAIALITLTLGIGATTAIFSVLDAVVLKPLNYPHPEQLVSILHPATVPGSGERVWGMSPGGYFQVSGHNHTMSAFGIYRNGSVTVTNSGQSDIAQVGMITASIFTVMEARPAFGRLIVADDDTPEAPRVAVLSHEFFTRRFGGNPAVVGTNLETSNGTFEIVGVTEPGMALPMPGPFASTANLAGFTVDVWLPLQLNANGPFWNNHPYVGLGRMKPDVTVDMVQNDIGAIFARFTETLSNAYSEGFIKQYNFRIAASPLQTTVLGPKLPRLLWMLFGAVALVLLIAAANVSNLFLVRFEVRRRESAVRSALGADRMQMATHYLAESLLLCLTAAAAAVVFAALAMRVLVAIAPTDIPRLSTVSLGWTPIALAFGVALLLGLLLGLAPLLRRGIDLDSIRSGGRGQSMSVRQRTMRSGLVVGQLSMALVLLAAAALMLRSFDKLRHVQPGFSDANVLAFDLRLPYNEYETRTSAIAFHRELQRRLLEIPGVTNVGSLSSVPLEDFGVGCSVVFREGRPYAVGEQTPCVPTISATPGVFDALHMQVTGRVPTWTDVDARTQAVVVTKALGDRLWPGENPIGRGIASNGQDSDVWYRVVGVVNNVRAEALDLPPTEAVFYATSGLRENADAGDLLDHAYMVRTNGVDPLSLVPSVRAIVAQLNAHIPLVEPRTMSAVVRRSMSRTSFLMTLLGVSAVVALVLSAVGIYGVISYVVAQRRTEIGIRMALGASIRQVVRMVMMQSIRIAAVGVGVGLAGALAVGRIMSSVLYDVSPTDPVVLAAVVTVLLAVVIVAAAVPARRAAHIDPSEAMRS
jgi:predicted permease